MRIDIKDKQGHPRLTVHVDPSAPPTVVKAEDGRGPAVSLDWDRAVDDEGRLRHCPVCGCSDLYISKQVPQLTVFALVIAAAVIAMVFYGFGLSTPALVALLLVLTLDVAIWFFAKRMLVCYRCSAEFRDVPISPGHHRWDANTAERYRPSDASRPAPDEDATR